MYVEKIEFILKVSFSMLKGSKNLSYHKKGI